MALDITLRGPNGADIWLTDQPTINANGTSASTSVSAPSLDKYPSIQSAGGVSASTSVSSPSLNVYPSIQAAGGVAASTTVSAPSLNVYPSIQEAGGLSAGTSVSDPSVQVYPDILDAVGTSASTSVSEPELHVYPEVWQAGGLAVDTAVSAPSLNAYPSILAAGDIGVTTVVGEPSLAVYPSIEEAGGLSVATAVSDPLSVSNRTLLDIHLRGPSNADIWLTDVPTVIGATAGNTGTAVGAPALTSPVARTPYLAPARGTILGGTPVFGRVSPDAELASLDDRTSFRSLSAPSAWALAVSGAATYTPSLLGLGLTASRAGAEVSLTTNSSYARGHFAAAGSLNIQRTRLPAAQPIYAMSLWLNANNHVDATLWAGSSGPDYIVMSKTVDGATSTQAGIGIATLSRLESISLVKRGGDVTLCVDGQPRMQVTGSYSGAVKLRLALYAQALTVTDAGIGTAALIEDRLLTNMEDVGIDRVQGMTPARAEPKAGTVPCTFFGPWGEGTNQTGFTYTWATTERVASANGTSIAGN